MSVPVFGMPGVVVLVDAGATVTTGFAVLEVGVVATAVFVFVLATAAREPVLFVVDTLLLVETPSTLPPVFADETVAGAGEVIAVMLGWVAP